LFFFSHFPSQRLSIRGRYAVAIGNSTRRNIQGDFTVQQHRCAKFTKFRVFHLSSQQPICPTGFVVRDFIIVTFGKRH